MNKQTLTVSVLQESGFSSQLGEVLAGCPRLQILRRGTDPAEVMRHGQEAQPDLVVVDLENGTLPPWLGTLTRTLANTAVMVCSPNREPDFLIKVIQLGVREFVPMPLVRSDLEAALQRVWELKKIRSAAPDADKGRMVTVAGLKGGMGATSLAVNLAATLAETHPERVVLVDLGRPFPDVAKYLDLGNLNNFVDLAENLNHLDAGFVLKTLSPHKAGLSVLHGCNTLAEWKVINQQFLAKLWAILRSTFDWVIVDLGHWLDEIYLNTIQEADQVLLLVDLQIPNVKNLKSLWGILQSEGIAADKVNIVVNRYQKIEGSDLAMEGLQRIKHQPVFFSLPYDFEAMSEAINHGEPLLEVAPRSKVCRSVRQLVEELKAALQSESTGKEAVQPKARRRFLFF